MLLEGILFVAVVNIALAHLNDVGGFLFGIFDFLPRLLLLLLEQSDSVGQKLNIFLSTLTRDTLFSESRANWSIVVSFALITLLVFLVLVLLMVKFLARMLFNVFLDFL